jgi:hypothetical protein
MSKEFVKVVYKVQFENHSFLIHIWINTDADLEEIQVDPINRKLFYSDTGNNLIASINLDGSGYQVIVNQGLDEPRGLALVPATQ